MVRLAFNLTHKQLRLKWVESCVSIYRQTSVSAHSSSSGERRAGCSSDSQRFAGLFKFGPGDHRLDTASQHERTRRRSVPRENGVGCSVSTERQHGISQPYPMRRPATIHPIPAPGSHLPVAVSAGAPSPLNGLIPAVVRNAERQTAIAQPFPATGVLLPTTGAAELAPDPMSTGTTPDKVSGWSQ